MIGRGIARTFQNLALFPSMTVLENVLVGSHIHRRPAADDDARALSLLDYVGLADAADREAGSLPYGIQKRVEAARADVGPKLLLLDERRRGSSRTRSSRSATSSAACGRTSRLPSSWSSTTCAS